MGKKGYKMGLIQSENYKKISINQLVKAEWNYKIEDEELSEKLLNNIKTHGQVENIIVRKLPTGFFEVVNGNHRYEAMKKLGAEEVFCYDLGQISDSIAKRIAIETNETKFKSDQLKLAELIIDITKDFKMEDLTVTMPYSEIEIEAFQKLPTFDFSQFDKKDNEEENKEKENDNNLSDNQNNKDQDLKNIVCPHCGKEIKI